MRNFIRRTAAALAVLCMAALLAAPPRRRKSVHIPPEERRWATTPDGRPTRGFTPDQIPAEHLTQINYAFAQIDPDTLTIALENPAHDQRTWPPCGSRASRTSISKPLISVGGWSDSQYFSDAAATAARRKLGRQLCGLCGGAGPGQGWTWTGGVPGIRRRGGDHPPPGGQAELHSLCFRSCGSDWIGRAAGTGRTMPSLSPAPPELVLKPDRGREGGRHCGPHLRDGL